MTILKTVGMFLLGIVVLIVLAGAGFYEYLDAHKVSPEESARLLRDAAKADPNSWILSKKVAHPKALVLMKDDFYWNCADDNSPFGNDNGADALNAYRKWRAVNPAANPMVLVKDVLKNFQAPLHRWQMITPDTFHVLLDDYVMDTGDDTIIGIAFGQLLFEGKVALSLKDLALVALEKEMSPKTIKRRSVRVPEQRVERLAKMSAVLKAAE